MNTSSSRYECKRMSDLLSVVVSKEKKTAVDQWRACTQTPINNDVTKICRVTMLGIVLFVDWAKQQACSNCCDYAKFTLLYSGITVHLHKVRSPDSFSKPGD